VNINIYLENSLGKKITASAASLGKPRNALIREALKEWLNSHTASQWPRSVMQFRGVEDFSAFESYRNELLSEKDDPLE
jgi:hypothetical protein